MSHQFKNGEYVTLLSPEELRKRYGKKNNILGIGMEVFRENSGKKFSISDCNEYSCRLHEIGYIFPLYSIEPYNSFEVELI